VSLLSGGDFGHEPLEQPGQPVLDLVADFGDLRVIQLRCAQAGGQVGDAGDAQHLDSHVAGDDGLRHGGHADQGCAQRAEGANLGGGLVAGAADGQIDALGERKILFLRGLLRQGAKPFE
jgi:hypothetical protein